MQGLQQALQAVREAGWADVVADASVQRAAAAFTGHPAFRSCPEGVHRQGLARCSLLVCVVVRPASSPPSACQTPVLDRVPCCRELEQLSRRPEQSAGPRRQREAAAAAPVAALRLFPQLAAVLEALEGAGAEQAAPAACALCTEVLALGGRAGAGSAAQLRLLLEASDGALRLLPLLLKQQLSTQAGDERRTLAGQCLSVFAWAHGLVVSSWASEAAQPDTLSDQAVAVVGTSPGALQLQARSCRLVHYWLERATQGGADPWWQQGLNPLALLHLAWTLTVFLFLSLGSTRLHAPAGADRQKAYRYACPACQYCDSAPARTCATGTPASRLPAYFCAGSSSLRWPRCGKPSRRWSSGLARLSAGASLTWPDGLARLQ